MEKGGKYGRLTCVKSIDSRKWLFKCECGNEKVINKYDVRRGHTQSCGCLHKENTSKARKIHGEADSRLNRTWYNMKKRCYHKRNPKYKNYGARGIKMCNEWKGDYIAFSKWAHENGYTDQMTIERIDVNGDYEPANCKWIPMSEQATNRTSNKWVYIDGIRYSPLELEEKFNIPAKTIYARIARGDTGESVVRPLGQRQFYKR
ncbi:hypothetical protein [Macrococcoides caseolyticum]|uniref:hypothetical protein n=1 Tax=Macrococcoides caseolyticum TaxID=69966 RepID=UPI000C34B8F6|nr:hypothetical protein [Macrococcus caseolyticus]PKE18656.1 hypothetical protein CW679_09635 [Macrococcus caseolyticus]PKF41694.1 hypothetical protein CW661_00730 [Macrococcus caseolyticus]